MIKNLIEAENFRFEPKQVFLTFSVFQVAFFPEPFENNAGFTGLLVLRVLRVYGDYGFTGFTGLRVLRILRVLRVFPRRRQVRKLRLYSVVTLRLLCLQK